MNKGYCGAIPRSGYLAKDGYYITRKGEKVILEPTHTLFLANMYIIELVIPDSVIYIDCGNNQLTKLELSDSVTYIYCIDNKLTELIVSDHCIVNCDPSCKVITRTMFNRSKRIKQILK